MRALLRFRAAVVAALVLAASACTPSDEPAASPEDFDATFEAVAGYPYGEADAHGLPLAVREILDDARAQGHVGRSHVEQALQLTFACFDDAGIQYARVDATDLQGLPAFAFTFRAPVGLDPFDQTLPWLAVADACQTDNILFVQTLFETQPVSGEARERWFAESARPQVTECLATAGVFVPDDANLEWFTTAAKAHLDETGDSTCLELLFG